MNLLVISHKETWRDPASPSGYSSVGGFPFQMAAIAALFDSAALMLPIQSSPLPAGVIPLTGKNIRVIPLQEIQGSNLQRKWNIIPWFIRHARQMWRETQRADAIHTPVGGDVGTIGIFLALLQGKRLFIRHCGTWGAPASAIDRWLQHFLEVIANERNVALATGGAEHSPSAKNPRIQWIFSTSLTQAEVNQLPAAELWKPGTPLRLITTGRLSQPKNVQSILRALPLIKKSVPQVTLEILGDGEYRPALESLTASLQQEDAVTFRGNLNHTDVLQRLTQAHLFIFPSQREGFPKALLEALACGLPALATRTSVIPQLLQNGAGILLNEPTPQSIAKAIIEISEDPNKMKQMGLCARQAAQAYTLEAWGAAIGRTLKSAWGDLQTE